MVMLVLVTIVSVVLAVVMSVVAWRLAREERRRSEARIAALSDDIRGVVPRDIAADLEWRAAAPPELFAQPAATGAPAGSHWGFALVAGVVVLAATAAIVVTFSAAPRTVAATPAAAPAPVPPTLELVALSQEREGDRLTIRGLVRNPSAAATVDRLAAVVSLFDRDGRALDARATSALPPLRPRDELPFVVAIPDAGDVGRFRVSFRSDDQVVPHVDRRRTN